MQQREETNAQLSLVLAKKFSDLMGLMELVKDQYRLENELTKNDLLQKHIKTIVGYITP